MPNVDSLDIQISASAKEANKAIGTLISNLGTLSNQLGKLNGSNFANFANGMKTLADGMKAFQGIKLPDFTRVAKGIEKFGNIDANKISSIGNALQPLSTGISTLNGLSFNVESLNGISSALNKLGTVKSTSGTENLLKIKDNLAQFVRGMNNIGSLSFDTTNLSNLITAIAQLGRKTVTNAITNLPRLTTELNNLMTTLSKAPTVSANTIQMTNALANLASQGSKVGTASNSMVSGLTKTSSAMTKTTKKAKSLASAIGKFYATWFLAIRGIKSLWKSVESSMDYIETLNYFNAAFGQVAEKADLSNWKELGYDSAEAYYNSFAEHAEKVTTKMTGFTVSESGMITGTGEKSLGLNPSEVMNYQAMFGQMSSSMGVASETATKMSQALTEIGADLASVKNMDFGKVWTDMASGLAGMSRTLDKYGVNIRNVNLQQKLNELGIQANIQALNQNDKALLRTIILLDSTKYAWADMADTIEQPANQLRLLKSNMSNLSRTIGNIFLPIVAKTIPYINGFVIALQRLAEYIVKLLGFEGFEWGGIGGGDSDILSTLYDDADTLSDNLDNATSSAKKLKYELMGFDEINKLSDDADSDSTGVSGIDGLTSGLLDAAFEDALNRYQTVWNKAFDNMENKANDFAKKVEKTFKKIAKEAEPSTEALKKLWNEGLKDLGDFTGTAFVDFYDEFLVPLGKWTLGTGLPKLTNTMNDFLKKINWKLINDNLNKFWKVLEPFAEGVGEGLLMFLDGFSKINATLINIVSRALKYLLDVLNFIPSSVIKGFGEALGILLGAIVAYKTITGTISIISKVGTAISGMVDSISIALVEHPVVATVAALTTLSIGIYEFYKKATEDTDLSFKEISEKFNVISDDIAKGIQKIDSSIQDFYDKNIEVSGKYEYIKEVADKYIELSSNYTTLTDEQKALLQSYADILKENVEGVEEYIDPITGAYSGTKEQLDNLIDTTERYYLVLGAKEKLQEYGAQLAEMSIKQSDAVNRLNEALADTTDTGESYLDWANRMNGKTYQFSKTTWDGLSRSVKITSGNYSDMITALERVNYRIEDLTDLEKEQYTALFNNDKQFASYMDKMKNAATDIYEAQESISRLSKEMNILTEGIASGGETLEKVSESTVDNIRKTGVESKESIKKTTSSINDDVNKMGTNFVNTTNKMPTQMSKALDKTKNDNEGKASSTGSILSTYLSNGFNNLNTYLNNTTTSALNNAKNNNSSTAINAGSKLSEFLSNGFNEIKTKMSNNTTNAFNLLQNNNTKLANSTGLTLADKLSAGFSSISNFLSGKTTNALNDANSKNTTLSKNVGNNLQSLLSGGFGNLNLSNSTYNALVGSYNDNYSKFNDFGKGLGKTFGDGVESGFDSKKGGILSKISNLFGNLKINTTFGGQMGAMLGFEVQGAYAGGGFPEDGLFFANHNELVGQFSNGKTAVANNLEITAGIEEAAYRGMMRALSESQGNQNVTIQVAGDPSGMFRVMQQQANDYTIRTGMSPFPV